MSFPQLNLKSPAYFTGNDLLHLREKIKTLAEVLRTKKASGASKEELFELIGELLELKVRACMRVRFVRSCADVSSL